MGFAVNMPIITIFSLTLAVAACNSEPNERTAAGNDGSEATASRVADPCSFVSPQEVGAITGEAVVEANSDGDTCTYQTEDAMASSVEVEIKQAGGADEMQTARSAAGTLEDIGAGMKGGKGAERDVGEALTGSSSAPAIGDQAFFGSNHQLHVLKGEVYFAVSPPTMKSRISGGNPLLPAQEKRQMAAAIAQKIASRL